jgi:hypothetical protein
METIINGLMGLAYFVGAVIMVIGFMILLSFVGWWVNNWVKSKKA